MHYKNDRAARGEGGLSSLQSSEAGRRGRTGEVSAETRAPADVETSWDPYQVWLTRVKEPREQSERRQSRPAAAKPVKTAALGETTTLRSLFHALHR